jgi:hypothetical protein
MNRKLFGTDAIANRMERFFGSDAPRRRRPFPDVPDRSLRKPHDCCARFLLPPVVGGQNRAVQRQDPEAMSPRAPSGATSRVPSTEPGAALRLRRLFLLALILFLLATAEAGSAATSTRPRRDPQLDDAGPPAFTGTSVE